MAAAVDIDALSDSDIRHRLPSQVLALTSTRSGDVEANEFMHVAKTALQVGDNVSARHVIKAYLNKKPPVSDLHLTALLLLSQTLTCVTPRDVATFNERAGVLLKAVEMAKSLHPEHPRIAEAAKLFYQSTIQFHDEANLCQIVEKTKAMFKDIEQCATSRLHYPSVVEIGFVLLSAHIAEGSGSASRVAKSLFNMASQASHDHDMSRVVFIQAYYDIAEKETLDKECGASVFLLVNAEIGRCQRLFAGTDIEESRRTLDGLVQALRSRTPNEQIVSLLAPASNRRTGPLREVTEMQRCSLIVRLAELALMQTWHGVVEQCVDSVSTAEADPAPADRLKAVILRLQMQQADCFSADDAPGHVRVVKEAAASLFTALAVKDYSQVEALCQLVWFGTQPAVKAGLRRPIRGPLSSATEALDSIQSNMASLRCFLHQEAALTEELFGYERAQQHWEKALVFDITGEHSDRISVNLNRVRLLINRYEKVDDPLEHVGLIIEKITQGKLQPDEDVGELIETAIALLLDSDQALELWKAQPRPVAFTRSASSVGASADSNLTAMKSVSVSHADGKLRLSRVHCALIKSHLLNAARNAEIHASCTTATADDLAKESEASPTAESTIQRARLWFEIYMANPKSAPKMARIIGRFAQPHANEGLLTACKEVARKTRDEQQLSVSGSSESAILRSHHELLLGIGYALLQHAAGLLESLSQQGVEFFQVPPMPAAVKALVEEDAMQLINAKKTSIRERLQAEEDALVEEKRKEREACLEVRLEAEEALRLAQEAEEEKKAGRKSRENGKAPKGGKGKDDKKKEEEAADKEADLPIVPEPFVPPEIVVPQLDPATIQEFKQASDNYQNWLKYLVFIKKLNEEVGQTISGCLDIALALGNTKLMACCLHTLLTSLAMYQPLAYSNFAAMTPKLHSLYDLVPTLSALSQYVEGFLTRILPLNEKQTVSGEALCQLVNLLLLSTLVPRLPRPPAPPPPAEEKKPKDKKAGGKAASKTGTASVLSTVTPAASATIQNLIVNSRHAEDLKRAMQVCHAVLGSDLLCCDVTQASQKRLVELLVQTRQLLTQTGCPAALQKLPSLNPAFHKQLCSMIEKVEMLDANRRPLEKRMTTCSIDEAVSQLTQCNFEPALLIQMWQTLADVAFHAKKFTLVHECCSKAEQQEQLFLASAKDQVKHERVNVARLMSDILLLSGRSLLQQNSKGLLDNEVSVAKRTAAAGEVSEKLHHAGRNSYVAGDFDSLMNVASVLNEGLVVPLLTSRSVVAVEKIMVSVRDFSAWISKLAPQRPAHESAPSARSPSKRGTADLDTLWEKAPIAAGPVVDTLQEAHLAVRASFFAVELKWLYHNEMYEEGVRLADKAIRTIPQEHQRSIAAQRLRFKLMLGRLNETEIGAVTNISDQIQLWLAVAKNSRDCAKGANAFEKALDLAESTADHLLAANMLVDYGTWLFHNGFPLEIAVSKAQDALSLIYSMPPPEEPFANEVVEEPDTAPTPVTKSRPSSRTAPKLSPTKKGKTPPPPKGKSRASVAAKTEPTGDDIKLQTELNGVVATVRIEIMARAHAIIADFYRRGEASAAGLAAVRSNAVAAAWHYCHMWSLAVEQAAVAEGQQPGGPVTASAKGAQQSPNKAAKEKGKAAAAAPVEDKKGKAKGEKGKKNKTDIDESAWKEPETPDLFPLPKSTSAWAAYELPSEAVAHMGIESKLPGALNSLTISDLPLTLKTLRSVQGCLVRLGALPLAMPLLALERQLIKLLNAGDGDAMHFVNLRILALSYKLELGTVVAALTVDGFPDCMVPSQDYVDRLNNHVPASKDCKVLLSIRRHQEMWAECAKVLLEMGYLHTALSLASAAEKLFKVVRGEKAWVSVCRTIATSHLLLGNAKAAITYASKGLDKDIPFDDADYHVHVVDLLTVLIEAMCVVASTQKPRQAVVQNLCEELARRANICRQAQANFSDLKAVFIWKSQVLELRGLQLYFSTTASAAFPDTIHSTRLTLLDTARKLSQQFADSGLFEEAAECFRFQATFLNSRLHEVGIGHAEAVVAAFHCQQRLVSANYEICAWARDVIQQTALLSGGGEQKDYTMPTERRHAEATLDLVWLLLPLVANVLEQGRTEFERWLEMCPTEKHITVYVDKPHRSLQPLPAQSNPQYCYEELRRSCQEICFRTAEDSLQFVAPDSYLEILSQHCFGRLLLLLASGGPPPSVGKLKEEYRAKVEAGKVAQLLAERDALLARKEAAAASTGDDESVSETRGSNRGNDDVQSNENADGPSAKAEQLSPEAVAGNLVSGDEDPGAVRGASVGLPEGDDSVKESGGAAGDQSMKTDAGSGCQPEEEPMALKDLSPEEKALLVMNAGAIENLQQALTCLHVVTKHCIQANRWGPAADAYWNVFRLYAQEHSDLETAVHYLAAFQSCLAAQWLSSRLAAASEAQVKSEQSYMSTAMRMTGLLADDTTLSAGVTPHYELSSFSEAAVPPPITASCRAFLNQQQVVQSLAIASDPLHQIKDFPSNFTFLILQHSPDRSELCAAVVHGGADVSPSSAPVFGKEPKAGKKKDPMPLSTEELEEPPPPPPTVAVARSPVDIRTLRQVVAESQQLQQQLSAQQLSNAQSTGHPAGAAERDFLELPRYKEHFSSVVQKMNDYLLPCLSQMESFLSCLKLPPPLTPPEPPPAPAANKKSKTTPAACDPEPLPLPQQCYVVVLADSELLPLPLEALPCLQQDGIKGVSRDFSANCLHQRLLRICPPPAVPTEDEAAAKGNIKDGKKKADKGSKKEEATEPWPPPGYEVVEDPTINMANVQYMVDPQSQLPTDETCAVTAKKMINCVRSYGNLTGRWTEQAPKPTASASADPAVWDRMMDSCGGLLVLGCGQMADMYPARQLLQRKMTGCTFALLFDKTENKQSFKWCRAEHILQRQLSDTLSYAGLLTLAGVGSFLQNALPCSVDDNARMLDGVLKGMSASGSPSLGQCVRGAAESMVPECSDEAQITKSMPSLAVPAAEASGNAHAAQSGRKSDEPTAQATVTPHSEGGKTAASRHSSAGLPENAGSEGMESGCEVHGQSQDLNHEENALEKQDLLITDLAQRADSVQCQSAAEQASQQLSIKRFNYVLWGLPHLALAAGVIPKGGKAGKKSGLK